MSVFISALLFGNIVIFLELNISYPAANELPFTGKLAFSLTFMMG